MSRYRKWVLTLGIIVATPGIADAGPRLFPFFKSKAARSARETGGRQQTSSNNNQQTADRIARALRAANLSGFDIRIEYRGGTAILTGTVTDSQLKSKAGQLARRVPGVAQVANQLQVSSSGAGTSLPTSLDFRTDTPSGNSPVKPAGFRSPTPATIPSDLGRPIEKAETNPFDGPGPSRSNQDIAQDVADVVAQAGLSGYEIEVHFSNGNALLAGMVADTAQRTWAEQAALSVEGVKSVKNLLQVVRRPTAPLAGYPRQQLVAQVAYQPAPGQPPMPPGQPGPPRPYAGGPPAVPMPQSYGHPGAGASQAVYNSPNLPEYAWPSYASYPNYAQVTYPKQYSASAWPYIGPFYPYPQIPMGWRQVQLEWDDGSWNLNFRPRTDKWWWFLNPKNW
jgi:osmotically-inducible protein OsmY